MQTTAKELLTRVIKMNNDLREYVKASKDKPKPKTVEELIAELPEGDAGFFAAIRGQKQLMCLYVLHNKKKGQDPVDVIKELGVADEDVNQIMLDVITTALFWSTNQP